jgi:hypothetical protein
MPVSAMRFAVIIVPPLLGHILSVLLVGSQVQMTRVPATSLVAAMAYLLTYIEFDAMSDLVNDSVRQTRIATMSKHDVSLTG